MLVVTHGYSKTVREVIKKGLLGQGLLRDKSNDKIFLLLQDVPDSQGSREAFDTRLMMYELKAALPGQESHGIPVSAGRDDLLVKLITRSTHVLVLLGAEAFSPDRSVIHPRGAANRLAAIKETLSGGLSASSFSVIVVAEGYKQHEDLLACRAFFEDHLDRVSVYPSDLVDALVSDSAVGVMRRGSIEGTCDLTVNAVVPPITA